MNAIERRSVSHCFLEALNATSDLAVRTWQAVFNFFSYVAEKIDAAITNLWNWVEHQIFSRKIFTPEEIASRKGLFQNMPIEKINFAERAITIHQTLLPPKKRKEFDENFECITNMTELTMAIVKAYIYSNASADYDFLHQVDRVQGQYEPEVRLNGELIFAGGMQMRDKPFSHRPKLLELQNTFQTLSSQEQVLLIEKCDFENIEALPISNSAKNILKDISQISNRLIQGNAPLNELIQELTQAFFSENESL